MIMLSLVRFRLCPNFLLVCLLMVLSVFLPSTARAVETWGIENPGVPWGQGHEGFAADGACYGMVMAEKLYHEMGLDRVRPFSEVTDPESSPTQALTPESKKLYLEQFAALAQNYAFRDRDSTGEIYGLSSDPMTVEQSLARSGVSPKNPQVMVITNHAAVAADPSVELMGHAVLIQDREETDEVINYTISDPNYPGESKTVTFDKSTGTFRDYDGYDTIRHDTTKLPDLNSKWMEALLRGAAQPDGKEYLPVWRGHQDMPLTPQQYQAGLRPRTDPDTPQPRQSPTRGLHIIEPPVPSTGVSNGISAMEDEEVGGVRLYFDPTIVSHSDKHDVRGKMVGDLVEQLTGGKTNFLLQEGGQRNLHAVTLGDILQQENENPDLGGLTRVLGFALNRNTGHITLLGKSEPDTPAIQLDVLSVALKVIWKDKATPAISLDPDESDFFGPQRVRLEGFPKEYRETEFTRIMLDADYAMKRILLGEDRLGIDGYQCFADMIEQQSGGLSGDYFRWWLCPKETSGAVVYRVTRGDMEVYLYDSEVKLLTETMKRASFGLTGTGNRDPLAERASNAFTGYYHEIEERQPIFRQLHGLFDVAKLAAILRAENIANEQLSDAAQRTVQPVSINDFYEGIGPKLISAQAGGDSPFLFIGGGVQVRNPLQGGDFISLDADQAASLDALGQSHEGVLELSMEMPSVVPLDPKNALQADGDMEAFHALDEIMAGDFKKAITRLGRVLVKEPEHVRARAVRALAGLMEGDYAVATKDIDVAMKTEPALRAFRGRILITAGDTAGGMADIQAAAAEFPDRPDVLMQKTWADVQTLDLMEAAKDLAQVRTMLPLDPEVEKMGKQLRLLSGMERSLARTFLDAQLAMPQSIALALSRALALSTQGNLSEATDLVSQVLRTAQSNKNQTDPLYIEERCYILMAIMNFAAGTPEGITAARGYLSRLEKKQPAWPSILYYHLMLDAGMPYQQAAQMYLRAAKMPTAGDPMLLEARLQEGRNLKAEIGFGLAMMAGTAADKDRGITQSMVHSIFDQAAAACPDGPARRVLSLVRKSLDEEALELKGKTPSRAEMERTDREFVSGLLSISTGQRKSDAVNLIALKMLTSTLLKNGCRYASSEQEFTDASQLFAAILRGLSSDWAVTRSFDEAAEQTISAHGMCSYMLARKIVDDYKFTVAQAEYDSGNIDLSAFADCIDQVAEPLANNQPDISPFSAILLRGLLFTRYSALLPGVDEAELNRLIMLRQCRIADIVEDSASGLVELKAASIWFTDLSALIPSLTDTELKQQLLVDFHRRAARLTRRFEAESALD